MAEDALPLHTLRRALIVKLRHHGDVLLSSPVFSVLKSRAPQAELDALVYAETAPMLAGHPGISRIHGIDRSWKRMGVAARFVAEWRLFVELRARRYDLLIHLTSHWRGAWLARALGVPWAVAPAVPGRGRAWHGTFTHLYSEPRSGGRHVVERNLDALRRLGIHPGTQERALTLIPGALAEDRIAQLLARHQLSAERFVQVHPSSRWRFKCWPADKMAALIDRLNSAGWPVVLTAGPDAAEAQMTEEILHRVQQPVAADLSGQLTLTELAALTARARLFIGVDSAPMHIAAAVGTPAVALFGPSREVFWAPWGRPRHGSHQVVASEHYSCRPCELDGCGGGKVSDCLVTLEVERVWAAVHALLQGST